MNIEEENLDKPNRTLEFEILRKKAYDYLIEQQKIIENTYGIHKYEDWFYDQETGIITFSNSERNEVIVELKYEEVGTISLTSETWLWSWANPNSDSKINTEIETVKKYGEVNNIEFLIKSKWLADEYDAWEMTSISAYLMKAKGAYRFPLESTMLFVIYKEIIKT